MDENIQVRISGTGGQGIILTAVILAEAAMNDGKNVVQSQSYGPESRGGSSRADIIISPDALGQIYNPRAEELDVLLTLSQEAYDKFIKDINEQGILIFDSSNVIQTKPIEVQNYGLPFTETAIKNFETELVTNIIALGALCYLTNIVSISSLERAIKAKVNPKFLKMNQEAVNIGIEMAKKLEFEESRAGGQKVFWTKTQAKIARDMERAELKFQKISHIGIAVENIHKAIGLYSLLGFEVSNIEELKEQKLKIALVDIGESKLELLQPTDKESVIQKFLDKKGPGIHHIAFEVGDIEAKIKDLKAKDIKLIDEKPGIGVGGAKFTFLHPESTEGVLIEICQH